MRRSAALRSAARRLAPRVDFHCFTQYLFFKQWHALREYAHRRGVRLMGDLPIFVATDSADVWAHPELFRLDRQRRPAVVAGVPPDYFSATGQLWGNPIYRWAAHRRSGFRWWIDRVRALLSLVDLIRLDHFRGFEACWEVPAGSRTAETGRWVPGPGAAFLEALRDGLALPNGGLNCHEFSYGRGSLPLVAEDLGVITPEVDALRHHFELPGMRILQFAFGGAREDRFLPHHYDARTVVYTGTHDNETTAGWYRNLALAERSFFDRYAPPSDTGTRFTGPHWRLMRLAWASVADLAIAPLQDVLGLGNEARMNLPGRAEGNWRWRAAADLSGGPCWDQLAELTELYQRVPGAAGPSDAGGRQEKIARRRRKRAVAPRSRIR